MGFLRATESKDPSNLSVWTVLRMYCTNVSSGALTGLDSQDLEGKLELPRLVHHAGAPHGALLAQVLVQHVPTVTNCFRHRQSPADAISWHW